MSLSGLEALGVTISNQARDLRRLLYCAEYIESHLAYLYAPGPDLLGHESALTLAEVAPGVVKDDFALRKL
jgi:coenzyme F420-reducing hydrogenase alpha subunit